MRLGAQCRFRAMLFGLSGGHEWGAGVWRCGGPGPWSPEPNASTSSTTPGLPSLEEGTLSLTPNHFGEPGPSYPPTSQVHIVLINAYTCRIGLRRSWMTTKSWTSSFTTSAQMTSMTSECEVGPHSRQVVDSGRWGRRC